MALLIDGYNLMHIAGFLPRGVGPGSLRRSRRELLSFVAQAVPPDQVSRTTVVFDAKDPPRGLPKTFQYCGITVWFSVDFENADELIEQLIRLDSAPRSLTVVSSDHRLHRAARRRRAVPVDSDRWFCEIVAQRRLQQRLTQARAEFHKPAAPSSPEEVQRWLDEFGPVDERKLAHEADDEVERPENPFPPGYGEDVLRELGEQGL